MKHLPRLMFAALIAALAIITCLAPPLGAQQFESTTVWSTGHYTNATGTASNVAAAVTLTKYDSFNLDVFVGVTNASAGTIDVRWSTSNDGSGSASGPAMPGASGWFSIPLTNAGTRVFWNTNITVASAGYWHLLWSTNQAGQHVTNVTIRAYRKPNRTG